MAIDQETHGEGVELTPSSATGHAPFAAGPNVESVNNPSVEPAMHEDVTIMDSDTFVDHATPVDHVDPVDLIGEKTPVDGGAMEKEAAFVDVPMIEEVVAPTVHTSTIHASASGDSVSPLLPALRFLDAISDGDMAL
ncbi:hypothetical protein RIF29_01951 [Crotalaria pallida]|uniref:Uncharacterized protein n=1 Tax=Crotalaria pallida TaxID=3830 RepID=A0AAN9IYW2_CROPI